MNDNINMDSTITVSMNDNINMDIFVPVSKPGPQLLMSYVVVQLGWEVIVRFVDIGGIDDHHSVSITTNVVSSNLDQGEVLYNIMW
jgi:hypothetical protein